MIRCIRFQKTGAPEVLEVANVDGGAPGAGEALVRHTVIGVNLIDTYHRSGLYSVPLPSGLGVEAAGIVERVGPGPSLVGVGQRVAYASGAPSAYADARVIAQDRLVPLPDDISDEIAAASLLKGMTAEYLIRRTFVTQRGQTVLFHAAAGGVGLIACQWLQHLGVRVIGTVGSEEKAEIARAHGCSETIVYTREDFTSRVRALTDGRGVPVVYDSVGKTTFLGSLDCLAPRGLLVSFGNASGKPPPLDLTELAQRGSLYVTRPKLLAYTATHEELVACAQVVFGVLRAGIVRVQIGQRFPLEQAREAHVALENRRTIGSTLLTV